MYAEEQQAVVRDDDPALQDPVIKQMVVQLRAMDSYGTYDTWSDARVLHPLVLTRERRRAIPIVGDPDEVTLSRVKAFYNALAQMIADDGGSHVIETLGGCQLTAQANDGTITLTDENGTVATVTIADVDQSNGVIHVIDAVLLPKS